MNKLPKFILVLCLALAGCTTATSRQFVPLPQEAPGTAVFVLFRSPDDPAGAVSVRDGDELIGQLQPAAFLSWQRAEGSVTLNCPGAEPFQLETRSGGEYHLLLTTYPGLWGERRVLRRLHADEVAALRQSCRPAVSSR